MKPLTERDHARTPLHIVRAIQLAINMQFDWDVCADDASSVCGPNRYFGIDRGQNSLQFWWYKRLSKRAVCFMNPPYSQLPIWAHKAKAEAQRGLIVVGLIPDMRSSRWFQRHVEGHAPLVLLPDGRINFDAPPGIKYSSNPWPSCVPVWTPWTTGQTQYARFNRRPTP